MGSYLNQWLFLFPLLIFNWMESCPWINWYINRVVCMTRFKDRALFWIYTSLWAHVWSHLCLIWHISWLWTKKWQGGHSRQCCMQNCDAKKVKQAASITEWLRRGGSRGGGAIFERIVFWFTKHVCTGVYLHMYTHMNIRILAHTYWYYTHEQYSTFLISDLVNKDRKNSRRHFWEMHSSTLQHTAALSQTVPPYHFRETAAGLGTHMCVRKGCATCVGCKVSPWRSRRNWYCVCVWLWLCVWLWHAFREPE